MPLSLCKKNQEFRRTCGYFIYTLCTRSSEGGGEGTCFPLHTSIKKYATCLKKISSKGFDHKRRESLSNFSKFYENVTETRKMFEYKRISGRKVGTKLCLSVNRGNNEQQLKRENYEKQVNIFLETVFFQNFMYLQAG